MEEAHCSSGKGFSFWFFPAPCRQHFSFPYSSSFFSLVLLKQWAAIALSGKVIHYVVFNTEKRLSRCKCHDNAIMQMSVEVSCYGLDVDN